MLEGRQLHGSSQLRARMATLGRLGTVMIVLLSAAPSAAASAPTPPTPRCSSGGSWTPGGPPLYTVSATSWNPRVPNELLPDQWLAKLYTEALGCAPDQRSYAESRDFVRSGGCDLATLRTIAVAFLTSREFMQRPYDDAERLLVLWRIARESEPDSQQFASQLAGLRAHRERWDQLVRSFFDATGFGTAVPRLCAGQLYGWDATRPVIDLPVGQARGGNAHRDRCGREVSRNRSRWTRAGLRSCPRWLGDGTGAELQTALDHATPGQTVWLAQGAVIRVEGAVTIPSGVRLETVGGPKPSAYAAMARLVRTKATGQPIVVVSPGATLASVWVDGQRSNQHVGIDHDSINVQVYGGRGVTTIHDDRIGNPAGWSNMVVSPGAGLSSSAPVLITGNLFTGYSTKFHYYETVATNNIQTNQFGFADGVSNSYGNARIAYNQMVDVTDVSFVMFKDFATPSHQRSSVYDNTIVNAGNSGWAAFTVDPLYPATGMFDFSGTTISHNLVWTSPNASLLVIAGIGTQPWFGDAAYGIGPVEFVDNTSGGVRINTQMAIAVSRMSDVIIRGNALLARLAEHDACPLGYIGVEASPGAKIDAASQPVVFEPYPAIPSVSHGCLVVHQ